MSNKLEGFDKEYLEMVASDLEGLCKAMCDDFREKTAIFLKDPESPVAASTKKVLESGKVEVTIFTALKNCKEIPPKYWQSESSK